MSDKVFLVFQFSLGESASFLSLSVSLSLDVESRALLRFTYLLAESLERVCVRERERERAREDK